MKGGKNMKNNFWLGDNELVIVYREGTHHVLESYGNYSTVFSGAYDKCVEYCKNREISYLESIIG